ncbi:hypothetical protein Tco_1370201 [Tanacetum coccineum]
MWNDAGESWREKRQREGKEKELGGGRVKKIEEKHGSKKVQEGAAREKREHGRLKGKEKGVLLDWNRRRGKDGISERK